MVVAVFVRKLFQVRVMLPTGGRGFVEAELIYWKR